VPLTDVFAALPEQVRTSEGGPAATGSLPAVDAKGLDQVKLGTLGELLLEGEVSYGPTYDRLTIAMFEPAHEFSEEEWVFRIPDRLAERLAGLSDDELSDVLEKWEQTDELQIDGWNTETTAGLLRELRTLARKAQAQDLRLWVWTSL
jgi:hypothetical protein